MLVNRYAAVKRREAGEEDVTEREPLSSPPKEFSRVR